jgi:hypothetical protein
MVLRRFGDRPEILAEFIEGLDELEAKANGASTHHLNGTAPALIDVTPANTTRVSHLDEAAHG